MQRGSDTYPAGASLRPRRRYPFRVYFNHLLHIMHTDQREPRARVKQASDTALCRFCDSQPRASKWGGKAQILATTQDGFRARTRWQSCLLFFFSFALPQLGNVQLGPGYNADIRCMDVESVLDLEDVISY